MSELDEIMGFDPKEMDVFNEPKQNSFDNPHIYKTQPKLSTSDDGIYRARLKLLYNPFAPKQSIVHTATYYMQDADGGFLVESSLGMGDKNCPIFKAWKKLWFSKDENEKARAKELFQKTEANWILVQIIEDENQPDLQGKIMIWKLPKTILVKLTAKMNPSKESKKNPEPLMDYLIGRTLELEVTPGPDDPAHPERKQREINYDLSEFSTDCQPIVKIDGSNLFSVEDIEHIEKYNEQRMKIAKIKSPEEREEKMNMLKSSNLATTIKKLYETAIAYLKENTVNIEDEIGFKPWNDDLSARVTRWISEVLAGNTPSKNSDIDDIFNKNNTETNAKSSNTKENRNDMIDDDLPF